MIKVVKGFFGKVGKRATVACMAVGSMAIAALPVGAAPATGSEDLDAIITEMETGFTTGEAAFKYLAIAAIPITIIVVLFFWLRGKFKQSVSGA